MAEYRVEQLGSVRLVVPAANVSGVIRFSAARTAATACKVQG